VNLTIRTLLVAAVTLFVLRGGAIAEDAPPKVKIKSWKADPVDLYDGADGKVVGSKPASVMPMEAERMGGGWLRVSVEGKSYYVESSQARTDLKLTTKPKCETLDGATGHAASRGLGEEACEP
jgi:hypothetical protein